MLLLLGAASFPGPAHGAGEPVGPVRMRLAQASGSELLSQAKILYDDLQYDQALAKLKAALKVGDLSRAEIVEVYKYMGFIYLIQGKEKYAEASFKLLLKYDPDHQLNPLMTAPKFIDFFNKVKAKQAAASKVVLRHQPPGRFAPGQPLSLTAYVVDRGGRMDRLVIYYRKKGAQTAFSSVEMAPDPADPTRYEGLIPFVFGDQVGTFTIEYYIAAVAADGQWLATAGDPKAPLEFQVTVTERSRPPPPPSEGGGLLSQWWFWAGAVVLVGAAGAGVYLAAQPPPTAPDTGGAIVVIR
ncbi:MAG: hypothetical protein D6729_17820 [Deltaproteobacteria bacterium]|nr:MAG: hypothetical protein D6729_17820 [Deltaproteobacteria bacterium]